MSDDDVVPSLHGGGSILNIIYLSSAVWIMLIVLIQI